MNLLLALFLCFSASAQRDSLLVVFWNVENFFDWKDSGESDSDKEFSSDGLRHWTSRRFYSKCNGIAKVLMMVCDACGRMPDAVGLAEVENSFVLGQLLHSTLLDKLDYRYIHFDSPDRRGIDCALLYRTSSLIQQKSYPVHLPDSLHTRDILVAEFNGIDILVNHHPSKVGSNSVSKRNTAMKLMNSVCDSLQNAGHETILSIGDFNDDVWKNGGDGTIKYNGRWEKIDGCFPRGLVVSESVFKDSSLLCKDKVWGGVKPLRTYVGPKYSEGISDHLPLVLWVKN